MATEGWARRELVQMIRAQLPPGLRSIPPYRIISRLFFRGAEHHISLLLHESFHAFQAQFAPERFEGAEEAVAFEDDYPWDDPAVIDAWDRELGLLAEAVAAEDDDFAAEATRRFLEARRSRRETLPENLRSYEREREWLEGLAKYVEMTVWLLADSDPLYEPLAILDNDPEWKAYHGAVKAWEREVAQMKRMATQGGTRFYYSGMAMAALLDRFSAGWKAQAMQPGVTLGGLLENAVGVDPRRRPGGSVSLRGQSVEDLRVRPRKTVGDEQDQALGPA